MGPSGIRLMCVLECQTKWQPCMCTCEYVCTCVHVCVSAHLATVTPQLPQSSRSQALQPLHTDLLSSRPAQRQLHFLLRGEPPKLLIQFGNPELLDQTPLGKVASLARGKVPEGGSLISACHSESVEGTGNKGMSLGRRDRVSIFCIFANARN